MHGYATGILIYKYYCYSCKFFLTTCNINQGRISGIADLKGAQFEEFILNGYSMSQAFKTAERFGHQPILVVNKELKALLGNYIEVVRKKLIGK